MAGFDGLNKWMKFAGIFAGCALVLFLLSASAQGWNGSSYSGYGGVHALSMNLGAAAFFCLSIAMMIFMSMLQGEMNEIAQGFICALSCLGGLLLFACVAVFEGDLGYAPVSSTIGMIGAFCAFLAFIFCILDFKSVPETQP